MTRYFMLCLVILSMIATAPSARADDPEARRIMEKVESRDDGDTMTSNMLMVLIDKNGQERKKYFQNFSKDYGKDTKRIMFIEKPANVRNTAFLTFDYDGSEKDDDQWLFMPALGKTKRIASTDKSNSFMGSDLNYSDMTDRELDDYDFKLIKEQKLGDHDVWLILSTPRTPEVIDETGYTKSILAVRKDIYMVIKVKAWENSGGYVKLMAFQDIKQIDGIWVSTDIRVIKRRGNLVKHKTHLAITDIAFNKPLKDELFTIRQLEKGL